MSIQFCHHRWNQLLTRPGRHWVLVALALYVAACLLPAMRSPLGTEMLAGWQCLTIFFVPWWWANPSILIAIILYQFKFSGTSAFFGIVAVSLGVHCEFAFLQDHGDIQTGCILWVISLQIIAINSIWKAWLDRKQRLERLSLQDSQDPPEASPHP